MPRRSLDARRVDGRRLRDEHARLREENAELRLRLEEAEQALEAIRTGQVESLVVEGPDGPRVLSLEGATHSYRVLVEAINEGAATIGDAGAILYCNGQFARMLDAPLERVMGSPARAWIPERLRPTFDALVREAEAGESRGELSLRTGGGAEIPAYLSMSVIHDGGRRIVCLLATDLQEQKRNEEIVAAERLARAVFEQGADAIIVCDEHGRVVRASAAAELLCGESPLLRPFEDAFAIDLAERRRPEGDAGHDARAVVDAALRGEVLRTAAATLRRGDGGRTDVLLSASALRATDRVIGCVVSLVDVSAAHRAEAALREADQRKNEFLATLSHELRNPLAPIRNGLYILERVPPGSEQARRAQAIIDRQFGQLARLVDDLLDLTRITSNKVQLKLERIDLVEILRRTLEDHRSIFDKSAVALEAALPREPVMVHADAARMAQVVGNLLGNAVKFTGRGGRTTVELARDEAAHRAVLRVADTGVGMAPDILARLFEPFAQADRTLERSKGGLGLGLALVKGLVEMHGGQVVARSEGAGRGAELVVSLPLDVARSEAAPRPERAPRRPRRVLLIEDNVDAAESLREVLELDAHQVAVAYDGAEGLEKARELKPEVVLCDIGLPGMDGYEVARALRADPAFEGVVLVALSGYARPEDLERAAAAGFHQHLAKPPKLELLDALLADVAAPRPIAREAPPLRDGR